MRRAKASTSTERIYDCWTEILTKLFVQFVQKIGRLHPPRFSRYFTMITKSIDELPNATWVPLVKLLLNSW